MHHYWIEDTLVLKREWILGFLLLETLLLVVVLALGITVISSMSGGLGAAESPPPIVDEVIRAVGAAVMFMILSGYVVSVGALTVIFSTSLLSWARASWLVMLFVLHAAFFLFYLREPAVLLTSALLIGVGVICVAIVTALEYLLWRRWLLT